MNIGGALGFVGQKTLNHYQWGHSVVNIVNSHLKNNEHVNVFNSGIEVTEKILSLEPEIKNKILMIDIGPIHGSISIEEHNNSNTLLLLMVMTGGMVGIGFIITYIVILMTDITVFGNSFEESRNFIDNLLDLVDEIKNLFD